MSRNYLSMAMLPMEDIETYLERISGFRKKTDISIDTEKVGTISSDLIAIAANKNGVLKQDRNTVENALNLNGLSAEQFLQKEDASVILEDTHKVSVIGSDEIKSLRDELYQMKSELVKNGMLKSNEVYNGLYDPFRNNEIKYNDKEVAKLVQSISSVSISDITVTDVSDVCIGEYLVIKTPIQETVVKIKDIQSNRLILDKTTPLSGPLAIDTTYITKTMGEYNDGAFIYGKKDTDIIDVNEVNVILKDGKIRKNIHEINASDSGFATTMTCPISAKGILKKVSVSLACLGNPGFVKAYIYTKSKEDKFTLLGESEAVSSSFATSSLRDLDFIFNIAKTKIELEAGEEYIVLIKTSYADASNKWFVGGYDEPCLDGIHRDTYTYESELFEMFRYDYDMYLKISTSALLTNKVKYHKQGIYTCNLDNNEKGFTRVRVELKVNREGRFKISDEQSSLLGSATIPLNLINEDSKDYGATSIFATNDKIVIGKETALVGNSRTSNTIFNLDKATYAPHDADVYRVGYKVLAKAIKTEFDSSNIANPIKHIKTKLVELKLIGVIPGKELGKEKASSDRLLFEGYIDTIDAEGYILEDFNKLEVQIVWSSSLGITENELQANSELSGQIYDLTISTDKAYNKEVN